MADNTGYYGGTGVNWSNLTQSGASSTVGDTLGRFWNELTGNTATNEFNANEAEKARLFNSAEAQKNRDWQTMMSNTAYSRAVADMKNAGINPASLGGNATSSPASTPGGSTASGVAAHGNAGGGAGILGLVVNGIGTALYNGIARSALATKEGYLDLARFKARSQAALNTAKAVEADATSALKEQERAHKAKMYKAKREETWWKSKDDEWEDPFKGMSEREKQEMIRIANTPWLES